MRLVKTHSQSGFLHSFIVAVLLVTTSISVAATREEFWQAQDNLKEFNRAQEQGRISAAEGEAILWACYDTLRIYGAIEHYYCISEQLAKLEILSEKPDLSGVSYAEQAAIEKACSISYRLYGKPVYYRCISKQLSELTRLSGKPDLSSVSPYERSSIERACGIDKRLYGPANYYSCIRDRLHELKMHEYGH
jgi:hypothetical protein